MAENKKTEQVATTPPATLEEALKLIEAKDAEIIEAIAAIKSKNAEIEAKEALLKAKDSEISSLKAAKAALAHDLEKSKDDFASYKEEAEAALESLGKDQVIVTDKPVLKHNGVLYTFKMTKFAIRGKGLVTAQQIIENPSDFEKEIEDLINKFKILKPFKG